MVVDQPSPPRRERSRLPVAVIGLLLVAAGSTALLAMLGVVDVDAGFALAAVLVAIGVGLIVGTWWGRARSLVVLGVPIAGLLLFSDAADLPIDAGSGDRTIVVDQDRELDDVHELLAGKLRLDLRDMPAPSPRDGVPTIRAEVAVGHLEVLLPADVTADVRTLIQAGDVDSPGLDGGSEDGGRFRRHFVVDGREGGERVRLDLKMGLGKIEVRHA